MKNKEDNDEMTLEQLTTIPEQERYKIIGKLKSPQNIARALNEITDDTVRRKTFNFIAKQFKGNYKGVLEIITMLDFPVTIPTNMSIFTLNNLNVLSLEFLIKIKEKVENYEQMKFKINEDDDSRHIEYSFWEISAIIDKIEELTSDIPEDMDEANKFYIIYSRMTKKITYDSKSVEKYDRVENRVCSKGYTYRDKRNQLKQIRRNAAGLYGGLINKKSVCAGYALTLCQTLRYVGMKSQYVCGYTPGDTRSHAWTIVRIDGEWYNSDATWDAVEWQIKHDYRYMLKSDEDFKRSHARYYVVRQKKYPECKKNFDYSKIKGYVPTQKQEGKVI